MNALVRQPEIDAALIRRVLLELRHARLRCELVLVEIDWATSLLAANNLTPDGALRILDDAMDDLCGGAP